MWRLLLLSSFAIRFAYFKVRGQELAMYDVIYDAVDKLGGVYVKLLQFLSLRIDVIPDTAKLRFLTFYDHVPIEDMNVEAILVRELGKPRLACFGSIETTPFASGSFGQVYKGVLQEGKEVIIKVKRSHLKRKLAIDFLIIRLLGFIFNLLFEQRLFDVQRLIGEFQTITLKELDYQAEVANALFLYEKYEGHKTLSIPYTYKGLSTSNIIVQEYVGGVAITDLLRMRSKGVDIQAWLLNTYHTDLHFVMKKVSYDSLFQIFTMEKFFSDPHPGNIKILPDNRYAFIDFGIMEKSPTNKLDYFRVVKFLCRGADELQARELGEQLLAIGASTFYKSIMRYDRVLLGERKDTLRDAILNRYSELIEDWRDQFKEMQEGKKENYTKVWLDLFMMGERFYMQVPKGLFAGLRASALITSFSRHLDPSYKGMKHIYVDITRDIDERQLLNASEERHLSLESAVETVSDWMSSVAEMDLMLYHDIVRLEA